MCSRELNIQDSKKSNWEQDITDVMLVKGNIRKVFPS